MWNSIVSDPDHCLFIYFEDVLRVSEYHLSAKAQLSVHEA